MTGVVLATGDLAPDRDHPDECFAATSGLLNGAELVFSQLETSFATHGTRLPQARHAVMAQPACADALARAGFDVISFAGNHCLDWGNEAFFETIQHLRAAGLDVVGVGENIAAARRPVFRRMGDGTRVAFLAYSSILPQAYWRRNAGRDARRCALTRSTNRWNTTSRARRRASTPGRMRVTWPPWKRTSARRSSRPTWCWCRITGASISCAR
jgi:poly-gamma-glutamate capsule biosynthesis protein CapA/YwtB (metallophosphatase superfamily)